MSDFYLLGNSSHTQMFGCVIKTANFTIVIDGGTPNDDDQLIELLNEISNSHVDAWFFTHPHHDHIGCFVNILKSKTFITNDKIYHHFPDTKQLQQHLRTQEETLIYDFEKHIKAQNVHIISANETIDFDDVSFKVVRVFNPSITNNFINNSSSVFRIDGKHSSFLILGDLGVEGGNDLIAKCPLSLLTTDYTQMAHHGQSGVSKKFYDYIKPQKCIWPTPEWLWNNDAGEGYNTGPWKTVETREWMSLIGVTEHVIAKDGIQKIFF